MVVGGEPRWWCGVIGSSMNEYICDDIIYTHLVLHWVTAVYLLHILTATTVIIHERPSSSHPPRRLCVFVAATPVVVVDDVLLFSNDPFKSGWIFDLDVALRLLLRTTKRDGRQQRQRQWQ